MLDLCGKVDICHDAGVVYYEDRSARDVPNSDDAFSFSWNILHFVQWLSGTLEGFRERLLQSAEGARGPLCRGDDANAMVSVEERVRKHAIWCSSAVRSVRPRIPVCWLRGQIIRHGNRTDQSRWARSQCRRANRCLATLLRSRFKCACLYGVPMRATNESQSAYQCQGPEKTHDCARHLPIVNRASCSMTILNDLSRVKAQQNVADCGD